MPTVSVSRLIDNQGISSKSFDVSPQTVSWEALLWDFDSSYSSSYDVTSYFRLKDPSGEIRVSQKGADDGTNFSGSYDIDVAGTWSIEIYINPATSYSYGGDAAVLGVSYGAQSTSPTLGSVYMNDYRGYTNGVYWVRPNENVRIDYEGHDNSDINNGDSYLRALPSNGGDARIKGASNGSAINNELMTESTIDLNGGGAPAVVTRNSGELQTRYYPVPKAHGVTHDLQGYLRDSADNSYGYFGLGKTIGADGNAPTLNSWNLTGYTYDDGTTYWGKPNDTMTFTHSGHDGDSGAWRGYIRLQRTDNSDEEISNYDHSSGFNSDSIDDPNITVTTGRENSYDGHNMEVEFDFTLGSSEILYDLGWYWYDACMNGSGYTETGRQVGIDANAPSISVSSSSRGWDNTDVSVTVNASDSMSGLSTLKYAWSTSTSTPSSWTTISSGSSVSQTSEGSWYLHVQATDNVGNTNTTYYGTYDIDKTPPNSPNVSLVNNTSHSFSLDWTNSDSLSGIDYVELYAKQTDGTVIDIDGDSSNEDYIQLPYNDNDYTIDGLSEYTQYDYKVITFDKAGNSSEDGFYSVYTDDITEPIVGYNVNSRDWLNTDVDETVNVDDQEGSGVDQAWYKWTNSASQPTDGWIEMGTTTNFATSQSQEGEWYLHVKAIDNYDNTAYDYSGAYKIDKSVPTITSTNITIDSPTGVYDTYTATVTWTIEDQTNLSGVDRTELGFYVDGNWYYEENNLPSGITSSVDMDNVTGGGSKEAIFNNIPREIDVATSWQGYDIATNETTEEQSNTIFTPRIYETRTATSPSKYEVGLTKIETSPSEYNVGITRSFNSPSEYIIDILSKTSTHPTVYEIGIDRSVYSPSDYNIGITNSEIAPSIYEILVQYDNPIFISGKFSNGIRVGTGGLQVDISSFDEWSIHLYRQGLDDKKFRDIFILDNGNLYLDGYLNTSYDQSWFTATSSTFTIHSGAIDIDELLIIPERIISDDITAFSNSAFYDPSEKIEVGEPTTVSMCDLNTEV